MRYRIYILIMLLMALGAGIALFQGCKKAEAKGGGEEKAVGSPTDDSAVTDFFINLEDILVENSLASIAIIEITDPRNNDQHLIRNIRQATMEQLSLMMGIAIREVSRRRVDEVLGELKGTASTGIDPDAIMSVGIELGVDVLLFASIESTDNDVFFWTYSTMSGDVIFSDTLENWKLPVTKAFDLGLGSLGGETGS